MVSNFFATQKSAPSRHKSKKYIINFESKLSIFSKIYGRKKLLFFELLLEFNPRLKSCDLCMKSVRVDETDAGLPVIVVLVHSTICTILYYIVVLVKG